MNSRLAVRFPLFTALLLVATTAAAQGRSVKALKAWLFSALPWSILACIAVGLLVGGLHLTRMEFQVHEYSLRRRARRALWAYTSAIFSLTSAYVLTHAAWNYQFGTDWTTALNVVLLSEYGAIVVTASTFVFWLTAALVTRFAPYSTAPDAFFWFSRQQ
jgi:hypothetical protein